LKGREPQRNADLAAGMERVLDIYRRPYDANFPVVCMDETPRQLIGETRTPVPATPGRPDSIDTLRAEVAAWQAARDRIRAKVDWQFTTDDARVRLKRLYPMFDIDV